MALDDSAIDRGFAASMLKAFREDSGPRGNRDALNGNSYNTGDYFPTVSAGGTRNILLENPVDSGQVLFVHGNFNSGGQIFYHKIDSPTIDTAGATIDKNNRLISDGASVARAESEVAFSGGNVWTKKVSGGAKESAGLAPGHASEFDIILDEGERVVYQLENISGAEIKANIDADYSEIDREQINELVE